jgi:hypothetical protein
MSSTTNTSMLIKDALSIHSRYVRAVNIGRDLGDEHALDGYLLTDVVRYALARLCDGLQATSSQRAWRITGSYGSGKSALGLFLASLFTLPLTKRSAAGKLLGQDAPELLPKAKKLPRYEPLVITGTRSDASIALANSLRDLIGARRTAASQKQLIERLDAFIDARSRQECAPHGVVTLLQDACVYLGTGVNATEGLLLIVDEMGRWLEYAADPDTDIDASFFQTLAEVCGGRARGIPLAMVCILHQRFEDYVEGRRDRRSGLEWAKVAERFEEITFAQSFESTTRLIARALNAEASICKRTGVTARANELFKRADNLGVIRNAGSNTDGVGSVALYPFHPAALVAAMTLFRRFGQNERSTFSFLLSSEPFALQDFINRQRLSPDVWYRVHDLCDWLLAQGSLRTLEEERLKRWALLQEVLRTAPVYDELEVKCLKVVGLLNLLEPQPGLAVTPENVAFALVDDATNKQVLEALAQLVEKCLLYIRPATQEFCLWPQSSVDVASELARIRQVAPSLSRLGTLIEYLPLARPIVAHRHYLECGTLRTAEVILVDDVEDVAKQFARPCIGDGRIMVVPCYPDQNVKVIARRIAGLSKDAPAGTILALRRVTEDDLEIAEELLAWKQLERDCGELRVDAYARTEVQQAIHRLTSTLVHRLADLKVPSQSGHGAAWWHEGQSMPVTDGRSLNRCLSDIFGALYQKAPIVRNELINRSSVSSAAAAARQRLLERMFSHSTVENLGIEMTPPEKAIYLSVLKDPGLHAPFQETWTFQAPREGSNWDQAWMALHDLLDQKGLVSVQSVIQHFSAPPFGMRESVTLLMIGAFLRVYGQNLILRERGTYLTQIEENHLARLVKRPESFELHMVHAQSSMTAVLDVYRDVLGAHLRLTSLEATIGELIRHLYQWYLALPEHTLNTTHMTPQHRVALALMGKAGDPVELFTVGLPIALGVSKQAAPFNTHSKLDLQLLRSAVQGFLRAGSERLDILRNDILKTMAEEVGVRETTALRPHIVALAEKAQDELVDYALKAFIQRSCDGKRDQSQWIDSLASLLGSRSIETWHDDTLLRFRAELRRVFTLLTRVVALAKLTHRNGGADHSVVAVHVVDQKGRERFVTVPADANGALPGECVDELKAMLDRFPVPTYVLARLLLDYSVELPTIDMETAT